MPESAVADTGPFVHLSEVGRLPALRIFTILSVSQQVRAELRRHRLLGTVMEQLAGYVRVERVTLEQIRVQRERLASAKLHQTDLSVAALADRLRPDVVLTDDLDLRRNLESQDHVAVGSVGVLIRSFTTGAMSRGDLAASLDRLLDSSTLYTSAAFRERVEALLRDLVD